MISMAKELKTWDEEWLIHFIQCFSRMGGQMGAYAAQAKAELDSRRPVYVINPAARLEIDKLMDQGAAARGTEGICKGCGSGYTVLPGYKAQCPFCGTMTCDAQEVKP